MAIVAKIFSTLGNPQSLIPLAVKDCANGLGMTAASSITSKEEGADRFIDEFGSGIIWIGGIPLYKKLTDITLFKSLKLDPKYDVRNLKSKELYEKTKEYAPTEQIKTDIERIGKKSKIFKNANIAKFGVSTILALMTYNALTEAKQKYTYNKIKKRILAEEEGKSISKMNQRTNNSNIIDSNFQNLSAVRNKDSASNQSPSFKGIYGFMLDPVKNTMVLDGGITTERLGKSRSVQELGGYAIKEGGFWFFMYFLGDKVQNYFEKVADKKYGKSVLLDARVLEGDELKSSFKNKTIEKSLTEFPKEATDIELYDFIHKNPENLVIKAAKESDIIQTYKKPKKWYQIFQKAEDTGKIDTRKFIDLDKVRATHSNIDKLYGQYNSSGETIDKFFNGVKKLKRGTIIKNIGSTILALGVVLPAVMLADRFLRHDNKDFAVETQVKEDIEKERQQQTDTP